MAKQFLKKDIFRRKIFKVKYVSHYSEAFRSCQPPWEWKFYCTVINLTLLTHTCSPEGGGKKKFQGARLKSVYIGYNKYPT